MKSLFSLVLFFCISIPTYAQWEEQISETNANLMSIDFVNNDIGWVAGTLGVIKGTTDGGQTWVNTGSTHAYGECTYYSICFPTIEMGYACGYIKVNGYNMRNWAKTENGGETWSWPTSWGFPPRVFEAMYFVNDSIGWRVDSKGEVAKITAGVDGFSVSTGANLSTLLWSIHFIDENTGWVSGEDGYIAKSIDGGNNWIELESGITDRLKSIFFINSDTGWAAGYKDDIGAIIKTSNGGDTWSPVNHPSTMSIYQVQFVNENTGWACGTKMVDSEDRGVILYTDDGGENWSEQYLCNRSSKFCSLFFIDETTGWVVGYDGIILKTTNAGGTSVGIKNETLNKYSLSNNYPNPFHEKTIINFSIPERSPVIIKIYDITGQEITTLVNEQRPAGQHTIEWEGIDKSGKSVRSGLYLYRINAGNYEKTNKMLLLK